MTVRTHCDICDSDDDAKQMFFTIGADVFKGDICATCRTQRTIDDFVKFIRERD